MIDILLCFISSQLCDWLYEVDKASSLGIDYHQAKSMGHIDCGRPDRTPEPLNDETLLLLLLFQDLVGKFRAFAVNCDSFQGLVGVAIKAMGMQGLLLDEA